MNEDNEKYFFPVMLIGKVKCTVQMLVKGGSAMREGLLDEEAEKRCKERSSSELPRPDVAQDPRELLAGAGGKI